MGFARFSSQLVCMCCLSFLVLSDISKAINEAITNNSLNLNTRLSLRFDIIRFINTNKLVRIIRVSDYRIADLVQVS